MSIGDLLGLIFLIIFVVGPVLRGLGRENPVVPPVGQPQEPSAESKPAAGYTDNEALLQPAYSPERGFMEELVVEELTPRQQVKATEAVERGHPHRSHMKRPGDKLFSTNQMAIMNGVVWHQIFSPPVALKGRKKRNERR